MLDKASNVLAKSPRFARRALFAMMGSIIVMPLVRAAGLSVSRLAQAFKDKSSEEVMRTLYGDAEIPLSDAIRITMTDLAEDGTVVPIKIETKFKIVSAISIIAVENPIPLIAKFSLGKVARGFIATRIKLVKTGDVVAVVETTEGVFQARKKIEITVGGCDVSDR
ncbi:MAG TPA: thiosulfate oxidation carrier protein SoxY [Gammaproteobacteria bacterium]|nr:thiosulfate oxidation carrier protein SoxY [Gammaproteobacteria bacterium]|tara:strand:- start:193 stop:690 length:498 start_codon:yes stop_codon:yes gene_type:complete